MHDKNALNCRIKQLKSAMDKYNFYNEFVNEYKEKKTLNLYILHINHILEGCISESMSDNYKSMIRSYNRGNVEPLLSNLYNKLLAADDAKTKAAEEVKKSLNND